MGINPSTPVVNGADVSADNPLYVTLSGGGVGTVTDVSVVSANGLAGSVANSTTTPAITLSTTISGLLKGNATAISAATAGTDYLAPPAGTSILKGNSGGALANASAGTDYVAPGGALGTPSSGTLINCSGLPISGIASLGTGVATALAINVGTAGAPVVLNGAGGTPSAITLTNGTGLPVGGITGLGTGVGTALAINVGSAGAPVTFNGALGTPSSGTLTNCTGLPVAGLAANPATYTQAGTNTISGTPSSVAFTSLTSEDIVVYFNGISISTGSAQLQVEFSVDNGSNYLSAVILVSSSAGLDTSARYGTISITGLKIGRGTVLSFATTGGLTTSTASRVNVGQAALVSTFYTASAVNAIRISTTASTFVDGGVLTLYGRG